MQQRAQDIIVLTRSVWQTPAGQQALHRLQPASLHARPRQGGSPAQPLNG